VSVSRPVRLAPRAGLQEERLARLLYQQPTAAAMASEAVEDAQLLGSLQLAGHDFAWDEVKASRRGEPGAPPIGWLRAAQRAVPHDARMGASALLAWHGAATGGEGRWRRLERIREGGPPPAPPELVASRLALLEEWLEAPSVRALSPAQQAALALARIVEIGPFDDANGRVSRLAASHLMVRAGARPPILVGADGERLQAVLAGAFRFETEPLTRLLEEASERATSVMIQALGQSGQAG